MPVESAHSPGSQLPENSVSQPLPQVSRPCGRSLDLPLLRESLQYMISQKTSSSPMRSARVVENILPSESSDGGEANVPGQSQPCCKVRAGKTPLAESELVTAATPSGGSNVLSKNDSNDVVG